MVAPGTPIALRAAMTEMDAVVLPAGSPTLSNTLIGGLGLAERAVIALHRGGIDRVHVSPSLRLDEAATRRLAKRGITIIAATDRPLASVAPDRAVVVVTADAVFEPAAVSALAERVAALGWQGGVASTAAPAAFALLTPEAVDRQRNASESELQREIGSYRVCAIGTAFCRPLVRPEDAPALERDYIRHRNGVEGPFTRAIRAFSVRTTPWLVWLRLSPNQVTMLGLLLAALSALLFSRRAYWPALLGALAYYASMVLDCSDGEVARVTFSDSKFGAWFETAADYTSYFFIIGGLVVGELRTHAVCGHLPAAAIAATASLAIVGVVAYLRQRVAGVNPGAFDDALAGELSHGTPLQRFAVWGRQLIKRSFLAHLILFHALIGHMAALLYVWAYGSVGALVVLLAVQAGLVRRVKVLPVRVPVAFGR